MTIQYVTWDRFKVSEKQYIHPTFSVEDKYNNILFKEFSYTDGSDKYMGLMTGDETEILQAIDYFKIYNMMPLTPEQALHQCKEWHGDYFELDADGFTIIDNRPEVVPLD